MVQDAQDRLILKNPTHLSTKIEGILVKTGTRNALTCVFCQKSAGHTVQFEDPKVHFTKIEGPRSILRSHIHHVIVTAESV